ncbi:type 11 methyltransferase [Trypanosoma rangeli]|uniref:Type 11 methyltransferase n=1 Tax=Trypanosoma rangeli TaxID=5698 RepID=A0A422MXW4_TRYRA|nr:type 11 methyltransferase [Trypanosoma rangeli]RNE98072.1 type 11 methyltransferase [Trypanosoma rangeli]|eukprot:RNE98072.1 type 11 methyltransferase [Trypanosoma rangeli]
MKSVVVDLRTEESYAAGHVEGAYSFPWGNIQIDSCGFPPRDVALTAVCDEAIGLDTVEVYLRRFCFASLEVRRLRATEKLVPEVPQGTCWSPNPFLSEVLPEIEAANGGPSFALDVGSGAGRDMVYLASRGWSVAGIENRVRLIRQGVALSKKHCVGGRVLYIHCDLKKTFPIKSKGPDLLHVCRFLHRPSLAKLLQLPRKGGFLVYSHFLDGCQKTEVGRPSSTNGFFLRGELRQLLLDCGYAILLERETLLSDERPFVHILARREK